MSFWEVISQHNLKLKSFSSVMATSKQPVEPKKPSIFLITAPTGYGKTTFLSYMYAKYSKINKDQMCLFYLVRSDFTMFSVFIDVIKKMRLQYLSVGKLLTQFFNFIKYVGLGFWANLIKLNWSLISFLLESKMFFDQFSSNQTVLPASIQNFMIANQ